MRQSAIELENTGGMAPKRQKRADLLLADRGAMSLATAVGSLVVGSDTVVADIRISNGVTSESDDALARTPVDPNARRGKLKLHDRSSFTRGAI
jgi:hypothetical protein